MFYGNELNSTNIAKSYLRILNKHQHEDNRKKNHFHRWQIFSKHTRHLEVFNIKYSWRNKITSFNVSQQCGTIYYCSSTDNHQEGAFVKAKH